MTAIKESAQYFRDRRSSTDKWRMDYCVHLYGPIS